MSVDGITADVLAEVARADVLHGRFPTIQHAAAVLRMELLHVVASAMRGMRLLDEPA